jgi:hypothetical protein
MRFARLTSMPRKFRSTGGVLAGVALGGLALWLIRRRSDHREEHSQAPIEALRPSSDSWLPDDVLDLPSDSHVAGGDDVLAEIFDRPRSS